MAISEEQKGLHAFEPQFGEATVECSTGKINDHQGICLFYIHASTPQLLEIIVTDFGSHTFHRVLSLEELDDVRDDVGVGGPWSDFVDYVAGSFDSDDVKLLVDDGSSAGGAGDLGTKTAKLIARKAKGMPRITFLLNSRLNSPLIDSANLSMALYNAFKDAKKEIMKERNHNMQLTTQLSSMKEKNDDLQKQLDAYTFKNKRTISKSKVTQKAIPFAGKHSNFDRLPDSEIQQSSDISISRDSPSTTKASDRRVRPRRTKGRGAILQDDEDIGNT